MATLQIGYWKIRGWAAPIRMLLTFTDQKYEEVIYECGDGPDFDLSPWTEKKFELGLPFPNLPYLFDGKVKVTQSIAILRYLARNHGLAGSTNEEMVILDMVAATIDDFRNPLYDSAYEPNFSEIRAEKMAFFLRNLKQFDDFLTGDYILGHQISFVDFLLYETLEFAKVYIPGCLVGTRPRLTAFQARIRANPKLESYFKSEAASWPFCNKNAYFGGGSRGET